MRAGGEPHLILDRLPRQHGTAEDSVQELVGAALVVDRGEALAGLLVGLRDQEAIVEVAKAPDEVAM